MDKSEITQLIKDQIKAAQKEALYATSNNTYHTHNNIDSPILPLTSIGGFPTSYVGQAGNALVVNSSGTGISFIHQSTVYGGVVLSGGTAGTPFPTGWTVAHTGTGDYTITHNLGTTNYTFTGTLFANTGAIITFNTQNTNTLEVLVKDLSGNLTDRTFSFIVVKI